MREAREITDRYHLGGVIGSAGDLRSMRAIDRATGEAVVFELLARPAGGDDPRDRYLAAAAVLAGLRHPALPAVLDCGATADGDLFLVREADVGREIGALAGESPAVVLEVLLQAIDGLALLDRHGLHHGALGAQSLRVVPGTEGASCRVVDLAHGLALGVAAGAEAGRRRRDDLQGLARLACRLLGAALEPDGGPEAPAVELPLAVSFEIEDAEALRSLLDRCLRRQVSTWEEAHGALAGALWGARRRPPERGAASPPDVRLTFSTEPPDGGLMPLPERAAVEAGEQFEITRAVDAVAAAAPGGTRREVRPLADETQPLADLTQPVAGAPAQAAPPRGSPQPAPAAETAAREDDRESVRRESPAPGEGVESAAGDLQPEPAPEPPVSPPATPPPPALAMRGAYAASPARRGRRLALAAVIVVLALAAAYALGWIFLAGKF